MSPLIVILLVLWAISGIGLVILILMHSGKGTGVSDMIASSMYSTSGGSNIVERNLDKLTCIFVAVFIATLLLCMLFYPIGTVG